jgi:DNA polymerase-3 subunit alpha
MLADVREEMISSLLVTVPLSSLDENMINEIDKYARQQKGSARLKFMVHDREENIYIEMFSRTKRILIDDALIQFLQERPEIDFKLN